MPLTVVTGPMFAGKSDRLIRMIEDSLAAGLTVQAIKPQLDTRQNCIKSRTGTSYDAMATTRVPPLMNNVDVLVIDEVHMFDLDQMLADVKFILRHTDVHIIASGVDLNCQTKPFLLMSHLLCMADKVIRLMAQCNFCRTATAAYTIRTNGQAGEIVVGDADIYAPICYDCLATHQEPGLTVQLTKRNPS